VRGRIAIGCSAAALAVVGGCGGGGSDSSSPSSQAEFAAEGNRLCRQDNAKFRTVKVPTSTRDAARYYRELTPLVEADLENMKTLSPPSDQQETFDAWIELIAQEADLVRQGQTASGAEQAQLAKQSANLIKLSDKKGTQLGLDQCISGAVYGNSSAPSSPG
jgi:hypothetical protein